MKQLPAYRKIDLETWPRREHFHYYRNVIKCGYSLTARVDVTAAVELARREHKRFYGCFLYAAAKAVNSMDAMRMMVPPEGGAGVWETSNLNFTVFHPEDETFTDLWMEYCPAFEEFYREFTRVVETYGKRRGIKGRPGQPANFFCISCLPWLDFTGCTTHSVGEPALFPIIDFGKYTEQEGRYTLPVAVTISHAAADGYHTSLFFKRLQEELDAFQLLDT